MFQGKGRGKKNARLDVAEKVLKYFKDHESVSETDQAETIDEKSENVSLDFIKIDFRVLVLKNLRQDLQNVILIDLLRDRTDRSMSRNAVICVLTFSSMLRHITVS